jgi:hypothetical protein
MGREPDRHGLPPLTLVTQHITAPSTVARDLRERRIAQRSAPDPMVRMRPLQSGPPAGEWSGRAGWCASRD